MTSPDSWGSFVALGRTARTPYQLADLGIRDTAVLLPSDHDTLDSTAKSGIADAVFTLDTNDVAAM